MDYWYHLTEPIMQQRYLYMKAFLCQADAAAVQALPAPGTRYLYSNVGYCIAAAVTERITRQSWEDLVTSMIFQPIGMTTAGFGFPGTGYEVDQPWQHAYADQNENTQLVVYPQEVIRNTYPAVENPAGFIYLSVKDWAKFAIQHLEGEKGGSTLLKPETFKILHTPPFGEKFGYALGWDTSYVSQYGRPLDYIGTTGTNFSLIWLLPDSDFGILLTTNTVSFDASSEMYTSILDLFSKFLPQK